MEEYPIVQIPIQDLNYKRYAPEFQEMYEVRNPKYLEWFPRMEKELPYMKRPFKITAEERLYQVYQSIKNTKKMWNPLIIKKSRDKMFYVIRGGQRLCALRALGYEGLVPCRIAKPEDSWLDNTQAWYKHPYVEVNYLIY